MIWHRNRLPTITVRADIRSQLTACNGGRIELTEPLAKLRAGLPNGYLLEVGGTVEESAKGQIFCECRYANVPCCGADLADDSAQKYVA